MIGERESPARRAASPERWTLDATSIRAAVIYYGTAPIVQFRRDLPVLYVRAGLDRPSVNSEITALASRAIAQNALVTLLNHPTGYHGFELFNDDDATRAVIDQTLEFVRQVTSLAYRLALAARSREAAACSLFASLDRKALLAACLSRYSVAPSPLSVLGRVNVKIEPFPT